MRTRLPLLLTVIVLLICLVSCGGNGTDTTVPTDNRTTPVTDTVITDRLTSESVTEAPATEALITEAPITEAATTVAVTECPHHYETSILQTPTCTADGREAITCVHCGDTSENVLPAIGHAYEVATTEATCVADGAKVSTCSHCGDVQTEVIPAMGHAHETVVTPATCVADGAEVSTCSRCGDSATVVLPAHGHVYETVTTAATCTEDGAKVRTCSRCGDIQTEVIPALEHDKTTVTTVKATCTAKGEKVTTCSRCDYVKKTTVKAKGHDLKTVTTPATCEEDGFTFTTCSRCDHTESEVLPALGHDTHVTVTDATCEKDGSRVVTCSRCAFRENEVIPTQGHHYVNSICDVCGDVTDPVLNGVLLEEYAIIYSDTAPDYNLRAARYMQEEIEARTGLRLALLEDSAAQRTHEIVVGETARAISSTLTVNTGGVEFAFLAQDGKIAMEGDYFVIAAAAYYFVETYIPSELFASTVPETVTVCDPIVKEAKNFIFLIGDGMGFNQTRIFDVMDVPTSGTKAYSDGEDIFYGYYLPHAGQARTNSLNGVTDSAAGGTALATGYKTTNGRVGKNAAGADLLSLTELAASLGKATAVMSTEAATGATPASFSAHAMNRDDTSDISQSQSTLKNNCGTIINCNFNKYSVSDMANIEKKVTDTLATLSADEDGFFFMYEEAHIDKHCHNNDLTNTFYALMRFNQVIGRVMEFAFYHPDTFVLITADHETGGLSNRFTFSSDYHTSANVPVFAYGYFSKCFHIAAVENTQIPITLAAMMGVKGFGDPAYKSRY